MWSTQLAGGNSVADSLVVVVKTADKTNLQFDTGLFDRIEGFLDPGDVIMDRLFTENMLFSLGCLDDVIRVGISRRTDEDGVDGRIVKIGSASL
jgi:hypothetical protein